VTRSSARDSALIDKIVESAARTRFYSRREAASVAGAPGIWKQPVEGGPEWALFNSGGGSLEIDVVEGFR